MIKKLIDKLLGKTPRSSTPHFGQCKHIGADTHGIDHDLIDERARNVVSTLQQAGYEAYIVGGAVRDLLLGLRPKDFDVATNATPEQVKSLFRRAFIIGRRFRIVHVVFGRGREHEVVEVSTFRAYMDNAAAEQVKGNERTSKSELVGMRHAVDASGRVLRDNVWGPQEQDATRRDFTINAMYYDPATQVLVDYHGGLQDAKKCQLRMIGDPAARYREDPVRIIRAVRFAAKLHNLGFRLEAKTAKPLHMLKGLLADVPQSRLFDEMLKLLQTGHALASIEQLRALGLAQGIYPLLDIVVQRADQPFVRAALLDTDRRVAEGKPVAPSFLLACVLWSDVLEGWQQRQSLGQPSFNALHEAIDMAFHARIGDVSGRGKLGGEMREIWLMQPRFEKRTGSGPYALVDQPRYRAAYDFMRLRAEVGQADVVLADWWQAFSMGSDAVREDLMAQVRQNQPKGGARRVRATAVAQHPRAVQPTLQPGAQAGLSTPSAAQGLGAHADVVMPSSESPTEDTAPRKRRRRRRRASEGASDRTPDAQDPSAPT